MLAESQIFYLKKAVGSRARRLERAPFLVAVVPLLIAGLDRLSKPASATPQFDIAFGVIMLVTAAANLFVALRAAKATDAQKKFLERAVAALTGVVLAMEGFNQHLQGKQYLPYAYLVAGAMYFMMSLYLPRLEKMLRYIEVDAGGIRGRIGLFKPFVFEWKDLASTQIDEQQAILQPRQGKAFRIDLRLLAADRREIFTELIRSQRKRPS